MPRQVDEYRLESRREIDNAQRVCKGNVCTNWTHPKFFIGIPFSSRQDFKKKIDKIIKRYGKKVKEE